MENEKIKEQLKEIKKGILEEGIQNNNNLEHIYKIIDIEKDLCEIEEAKDMRYGRYDGYSNSYGRESYGRDSYGEYNDGYGGYGARRRDSRGRYMERGRDAKYRGEDMLDEMHESYGRYMENRERYGASEDTNQSFHYMVKALEDFIQVLHQEAETQEQKQMLREALQNSMQM